MDPQKVEKKQCRKSGLPRHVKSSKINKFAKSPSSRVDIPRFGFLVTKSVIKDQKSALDGHTGKLGKFHQQGFTLSQDNIGPEWS